jgi:purine-nucleoside phosphorylase
MSSWTELALECGRFARAGLRLPEGESPVAVVLGSGLGAFADALLETRALPFAELPGFPPATVQGHQGRLVYGRLEAAGGGPPASAGEGAADHPRQAGSAAGAPKVPSKVPVLVLQGRLHGYEGHDAATVAFPARVLGVLGARALVVTNAAGGCNPSFAPGDLMRITDHINLTGRNPLIGPNEEKLGPRFPDLSRAYDPRLAQALEESARESHQQLRAGVYLQMNGPSYESPAEIRMARELGADAVGMSTVPEVIAAAHMGLPVCGISCITNLAAGIAQHALTHQEVMEVARAVEGRFLDLLRAFLPRAFAAVPERKALA